MCRVLQLPRSTYYYESKQKLDDSSLVTTIVDIFKSSRNNYGTRKIKKELVKKGMIVSRRRIGRIMKPKIISNSYYRITQIMTSIFFKNFKLSFWNNFIIIYIVSI